MARAAAKPVGTIALVKDGQTIRVNPKEAKSVYEPAGWRRVDAPVSEPGPDKHQLAIKEWEDTGLTVPQLREFAESVDMALPDGLKKADIIQALVAKGHQPVPDGD